MKDPAPSLCEAALRAIVAGSPLAICVVDASFRLVWANPAAMEVFGRVPGAIGRSFDEVMFALRSHASAEEVIRRFRHTLRTGEPYGISELEHECRDEEGAECYELQLERIPLGDARHGVVCHFRDVSAHVLARRELARAARHKDEFLATLSHELRNPLAPIRHALVLLAACEDTSPRVRRLLQTIERQVDHLVRMVDDLLEVSRISRGKIELRMQPTDVATIVHGAIETSRPFIDAAEHELIVSLPPQPLTVVADSVRISQVLANLLNNAAKYTNPGGRIWLTVSRERGDVVLSVRDDGVGIPARVLPRIFDMFVQVDPDHGRAHGGLGIGLAVVKKLVEMHGGTVEARSSGPGEGSELVVRLPAGPPMPAPAAPEPAPEPAPELVAGRSSCRVLVVDDNVDAASMLGMLLEVMGHEVRVVLDGAAALRAVAEERPEVVFLDLGMPGMSGYEVAQRLREAPANAAITLVVLTGWGQAEDRQRTQAAGFHHHLIKPVDRRELEAVLEEVAAKTRGRQRSPGR